MARHVGCGQATRLDARTCRKAYLRQRQAQGVDNAEVLLRETSRGGSTVTVMSGTTRGLLDGSAVRIWT